MVALMFTRFLPVWTDVVLVVVTLVGLALAAREWVRPRFVVAFALALSLCAAMAVTVKASDEFVMPDMCKQVERYSAEWWVLRCFLWEDGGDPPAPMSTVLQPAPKPSGKKK